MTTKKNGTDDGHPIAAPGVIRQMLDPSIMTRGRVSVIGLGGIGLWLVRAVVTFSTGLCQASDNETIELLLCDGDRFTLENTYRMDVPEFGNKAAVVGHDILERSDCAGLIVRWEESYVTPENVDTLIGEGDCVLLACDNHATRGLVGSRCARGDLENVVLISGGNDGVENGQRGTYGNVQVYVREQGRDLTSPLGTFHPEIADPQDEIPDDASCINDAGQGTPQLSITNMCVASTMTAALLRLMMPVENERMYDEASLDVLETVCAPHWLSGPRKIDADA